MSKIHEIIKFELNSYEGCKLEVRRTMQPRGIFSVANSIISF